MGPLVTTYTATCHRDSGSWSIRIAQLDRTTRAARLSDVDVAARRLIAAATGEDADHVRVVVDLQVPEGLSRLLDAAAAAREQSDLVSVEAVTLRRRLARQLTSHGYAVRDVASLLGVSYWRAQQLVGDSVDATAGSDRARTGTTTAAQAKAHTGFAHEAFLYRGENEFVAGTVPFIQDAVALGQPVLVLFSEPKIQLLRSRLEALGVDLNGVHFSDVTHDGHNPARLIPALFRFIAEQPNPSRPVRAIGESLWAGRRAEEVAECQLHEGLLNLAVDPDAPVWVRCCYDAAGLDPRIVDEVGHSHPALVEGSYRGSTSYGGLHHVDSIFRSELAPAPREAARLPFAALATPERSDVAGVRRQVTGCAIDAGLDAERARALTDAMVAIGEHSARHGGGESVLRTWVDGEGLRCEISDAGRIDDQLVGRRLPAIDGAACEDSPGAGLWLANQTCDLVQVRSTDRGTTVRISTWL
jgi:hypothetical protein